MATQSPPTESSARDLLGRRVELEGLEKAAELNGVRGVVSGFDEATQRCVVDVWRAKRKLCKRSNLKRLAREEEDAREKVDVVVIPAQDVVYYEPATTASLEARSAAITDLVWSEVTTPKATYEQLGSPYWHFYRAGKPTEVRWMAMWMLDLFGEEPVNENLTRCGWNASDGTQICGPVVLEFVSENAGADGRPVTHYPPFPYDSGLLEAILKEHAQARTWGSAARDRLDNGDLSVYGDATPGFQSPPPRRGRGTVV